MALTVREAMALEGVRNLALVAGQAGLDRVVQHVTVIEIVEVASRKGCSALARANHRVAPRAYFGP